MPNTTSDQVASAILETVPPTMRAIREQMRSARVAGLSVPQFRLLRFVRRNPGTGLSALAEHLGTTMPAASQLVERVVRAGFLTRQQDPRERRRVELHITEAGGAVLDLCDERTRAWLCERLDGLDPEQLEAIADALKQVRTVVETERPKG
jgi:DNA-binding MarR family transcriptional regulator